MKITITVVTACVFFAAGCGNGSSKSDNKPTTGNNPPVTATNDAGARPDAKSATTSATKYDVSTKEAVVAVLEKMIDNDLDDRDVCVKRPDAFPDLVVVGYFAHDAGCEGDEVFYKGVHYAQSSAAIGDVMTAMGWGGGDEAKRKKFALAWSDDVIQAFEGVMSSTKAPNRFSATYHPPEVVANADGSVTVRVWIQEESGMSRDDYFRRAEHVYAADGSSVTSKVLERITVEWKKK